MLLVSARVICSQFPFAGPLLAWCDLAYQASPTSSRKQRVCPVRGPRSPVRGPSFPSLICFSAVWLANLSSQGNRGLGRITSFVNMMRAPSHDFPSQMGPQSTTASRLLWGSVQHEGASDEKAKTLDTEKTQTEQTGQWRYDDTQSNCMKLVSAYGRRPCVFTLWKGKKIGQRLNWRFLWANQWSQELGQAGNYNQKNLLHLPSFPPRILFSVWIIARMWKQSLGQIEIARRRLWPPSDEPAQIISTSDKR